MSEETSGETRAERAWRIVRTEIENGNPENVASKLALLHEEERRLIGKRLPDLFKKMRRGEWRTWGRDGSRADALKVAGAGCVPGAAAAATWLCRADLRTFSRSNAQRISGLVAKAAAHRPAAWRGEVARRMAARLPLSINDDGATWMIVDRLARDSGESPPVDDGFVAGWIMLTSPRDIPGDPFAVALLPRLFEMDAAGRMLDTGDWGMGAWTHTLVAMVAAGQADRSALLDGCVRRLLRGGRIQDLRWYGVLHDALEPTVPESTARLRDYLRLLPAAPGGIAELAMNQVRRVDEAGALDEAAFAEAAEALLFRPEKKLVRAALTWLDRTARPRGRVDATLAAVTAAFGQDALDLQERAAKIAARHAGAAGPDAREAVRQAAATLHGEARELIAAEFGPVEPPAPEPLAVLPPAPAPAARPLPAPITSLAELAEAAEAGLHAGVTMADGERLLAGVIELAYRDTAATRRALEPVAHALPPRLGYRFYLSAGYPAGWIVTAVMPLFPRRLRKSLPTWATPAATWSGPDSVLLRRAQETAEMIGRVPLLLATPTETTGHIDPGVLVDRLERLEKEALEPGPLDLDLALLRLPREIDAGAVARARRLTSPAGRAAASRMASGGLPDPSVTCAVHRVTGRPVYFENADSSTTDFLLPTVSAPDAEGAAASLLLRLPGTGEWTEDGSLHDQEALRWWPSLLPSHREVIAAHLLPYLIFMMESRDGQSEVLLALTETDGPVGAATASVLALGLSMRPEERVGAVDALLTLCGRRQLPAAALGEAIATLGGLGHVKLTRIVESLTEAVRAGAHHDVFAVLTAALPGLLPAPGRRAPVGVPDLIALATQTAETIGGRADVPGLADVAGRGGSSRLVRESARLHRVLTGA